MTEVYMKSKTPFSVFQPSPHISTLFRKCLLIALSILQRNKWNKHSVIPEQKKCMTKENFLHSRSLHAFHLSYPSVNENIFLNLRSLMKQKKPTCRAAFPTRSRSKKTPEGHMGQRSLSLVGLRGKSRRHLHPLYPIQGPDGYAGLSWIGFEQNA